MYHGYAGQAGLGYGIIPGFPIGSILLIALLVVGLSFVVIALRRVGRRLPGGHVERGLEILIERYARGEIDAERFRAMKAEIEATSSSPAR